MLGEQVRPGPALRFHPLSNLQQLQHPASPDLPKHDATLPNFRHGRLECRVCGSGMNLRGGAFARRPEVILTKPSEELASYDP